MGKIKNPLELSWSSASAFHHLYPRAPLKIMAAASHLPCKFHSNLFFGELQPGKKVLENMARLTCKTPTDRHIVLLNKKTCEDVNFT